MSEHELAEGAITRDEIAELAALFDRFEFAFNPLSVDAKEAESEFEERIRALFAEREQARPRRVFRDVPLPNQVLLQDLSEEERTLTERIAPTSANRARCGARRISGRMRNSRSSFGDNLSPNA